MSFVKTGKVNAGDLIIVGGVFFYVISVDKHTDPRFPGLVFSGHWWHERGKRGKSAWSSKMFRLSAHIQERWRVDNASKKIFPTLPAQEEV